MKTLMMLTTGLLMSLGSVLSLAQDVTFKATEVTKGLYVLQGVGGFSGGNIAVSVGDDGVVMIDDSMPHLIDPLNAALKQVVDKPIDFLINTHAHADHIGNNATFGGEGVHIVAHANLRDRIMAEGIDGPDGKKPAPGSALPVITFKDAISFHLNGVDTEIFHLASAHTDGDSAVYFRDLNVLHTGDVLFNGMFPFIDLDSGGSVDGYIAGQKTLYDMSNKDTIIIPGHGELGKREDLKKANDMLMDAKKRVAKLKAKGMTEDQVVEANPLKKYESWSWPFITTEKITRTIYKDLK